MPYSQDQARAEITALVNHFSQASLWSQPEAQIDALVYELYGLTKDEIAVVEGQ